MAFSIYSRADSISFFLEIDPAHCVKNICVFRLNGNCLGCKLQSPFQYQPVQLRFQAEDTPRSLDAPTRNQVSAQQFFRIRRKLYSSFFLIGWASVPICSQIARLGHFKGFFKDSSPFTGSPVET